MDQKKLRTASTRLQPLLALALLLLLGVGCMYPYMPAPAPVSALHKAAESNDALKVEKLIAKGADIYAYGGITWDTPLHWAARGNCLDAARALIKHGADPDYRSRSGDGPLHTAARHNATAVLKLLLEHGADKDLRGHHSRTPLFAAANENSLEAVKFLLEAKADPDLPSSVVGRVPLHAAAEKGHREVVAMLLAAGAEPNARGETEKQLQLTGGPRYFVGGAIEAAARRGDSEIVRMMLEAGAVLTLRDHDHRTPLYGAKGPEVLELLIAAGAHVKDLDRDWNTPLHLAPTAVEVEFLISHGADIAATNKHQQTSLVVAISEKRHDAAVALIKAGSLVTRDKDGWTALHWAARKGDDLAVDMLVKAGADVNAQSYFGYTAYDVARNLNDSTTRMIKPDRSKTKEASRQVDEALSQLSVAQLSELLLHAAKTNKPELIHRLVRAGASLSHRDFRHCTALHIAVENRSASMVKALIEVGADTEAVETDSGRTPLHYVQTMEDLSILLAAGADVSARDRDGDSALHSVAGLAWSHFPRAEMARMLIDAGAEVNARNKEGDTPLHVAVSSEDAKLVQELLDAGADVHAKAKDGRKPMHIGSIYGPARDVGGGDVFALLMAAGADINETDPQGRTALHWAASSGRERMCELLIPRMKDVNAADAEGDTALHFAALGRTINCLRCIHPLIRGGANVNARNAMGRTPLHIAALKGDRDRSSALLEHKADKSAKDNEGHTPYDLGEKLHSGFRERLEPGGK